MLDDVLERATNVITTAAAKTAAIPCFTVRKRERLLTRGVTVPTLIEPYVFIFSETGLGLDAQVMFLSIDKQLIKNRKVF